MCRPLQCVTHFDGEGQRGSVCPSHRYVVKFFVERVEGESPAAHDPQNEQKHSNQLTEQTYQLIHVSQSITTR